MPESELHDRAIEHIRALLEAWVGRTQQSAKVLRNIGIRWVPSEPRAGFDPDLCLLALAQQAELQAEVDDAGAETGLSSLRLWDPKLAVPRLAIEIVSQGHPYKDYVDTPERVAACGIGELWIYDPELFGPKHHGGPHLLQIWQAEQGRFERVHAGSGPAYSRELGAWLHPTASHDPTQARLQISDDREGQQRWLTVVEQRSVEAEQERQRSDAAERRALAAEQRARETEQRVRDTEQRAEALERELAALRAEAKRSK